MNTVSAPGSRRATAIVVPVYNAFAAFEACIAALEQHSPNCPIIVVDDASTDSRIGSLLQQIEGRGWFRVLRNPENLGYTRSINIAIASAGQADIVLLNSDARVTPRWLEGLVLPALLDSRVGTVTAMSDNAGAFSFPEASVANSIPAGTDPDAFAERLVTATGGCPPVETPTGSGFCMWIRAELIAEIGSFDESAFPRGYGEENDFCMRAIAAGWHNVITPWSYIYHERSASFGAERIKLAERGIAEVKRRYPHYMTQVKQAFSAPEMVRLRKAASLCFS